MNDIESVFERFCILTVDGKMSDTEAFNFLKTKINADLFNLLQLEVYRCNTILSKK